MDLKPIILYDEVWIPAEALRAPTIKPATYVTHGISGAWEFSDATDDTIIASMRIPDRMNKLITPNFGIGWSADGVSPGNCKWQLEYLWRAPGEDLTAAAEAILSAIEAASSTSNGGVLTLMELEKPSEDDFCLEMRLKRMAADAGDTIADTAELKGICLKFNKLTSE